jgi:hypothetical protein
LQKQFDSYRSQGEIEGYLSSVGVDVTWYMDTPLLSNGVGTDGPSMIADAAQGDQAALEAFPDTIQWAMFPAGTFLHIDMAELNLGIVRDSTLNATNDFQPGETFEGVADRASTGRVLGDDRHLRDGPVSASGYSTDVRLN